MRVPTIHLNGTSRDDILAQLRGAYAAVSAAIVALGEAAPHGRDYYPQGDRAICEALDDHSRRVRLLSGVAVELEAMIFAVYEGCSGVIGQHEGERHGSLR